MLYGLLNKLFYLKYSTLYSLTIASIHSTLYCWPTLCVLSSVHSWLHCRTKSAEGHSIPLYTRIYIYMYEYVINHLSQQLNTVEYTLTMLFWAFFIYVHTYYLYVQLVQGIASVKNSTSERSTIIQIIGRYKKLVCLHTSWPLEVNFVTAIPFL